MKKRISSIHGLIVYEEFFPFFFIEKLLLTRFYMRMKEKALPTERREREIMEKAMTHDIHTFSKHKKIELKKEFQGKMCKKSIQ